MESRFVLPVPATRQRHGFWLLGPAFVAAIAYVDPGNVAANVSAGAQFGFLLVWVILVANVMAGLVQYLSAKLGLVTGRSLPESVADRASTKARIAYWIQAELVAMATDLAEVVGGAIALYLLFDLPCCSAASSPARCRCCCWRSRTTAGRASSSG